MREEAVSSTYWFMINSHARKDDPSPVARKRIKDFVDGVHRIFMSPNVLNMIKILDEEDIEEEIPKEKLIQRINCNITMEIGEKNGMYHCHVYINIHHHSTIMFVTNRVARYFNLKYGQSFMVSPGILKRIPDFLFDRYLEKSLKKLPALIINTLLTDENGDVEPYFKQYK